MEWLESGDTLINNKKKAGKKGWVKILRATPSFESSNKISVPGFCNRESARETIHYTVYDIVISIYTISILLSLILFVTVIRSQSLLLPPPLVATGFSRTNHWLRVTNCKFP